MEIGGYEEPKKMGHNNFVQIDGSPKAFPDYTNLESIRAIPWVPERAYTTGPDHHELKRIHGTGPSAKVRELDARQEELIEKRSDTLTASPKDCLVSAWSAWGCAHNLVEPGSKSVREAFCGRHGRAERYVQVRWN